MVHGSFKYSGFVHYLFLLYDVCDYVILLKILLAAPQLPSPR